MTHFCCAAYGADCGGRSGRPEGRGRRRSVWLRQESTSKKRRIWWSWRMIQMSGSGQVRHLSQGARQVTPPPQSRSEAGGRLTLTSHELEANNMAASQPRLTKQRLWTEDRWMEHTFTQKWLDCIGHFECYEYSARCLAFFLLFFFFPSEL